MVKLDIEQVVEKLNEFLHHDPLAVGHLVDLRVDCGPLYIAQPKTHVHASFYGRPLMGIVEMLNTLFAGERHIVAIKTNDKLRRFYLLPADDSQTKLIKIAKRTPARKRKTARVI